MNVLRKIKQYYQSHLWCPIITILASTICVIALVFQLYLRNEYLSYAVEKSVDTETAILASAQKSSKSALKEYIAIGSEMAVSQELYQSVKNISESNYSNHPFATLNLYSLLTDYSHYSNGITAIAVADKTGLVCQYDRNKFYSISLWNTDTYADLTFMYNEVVTGPHGDLTTRYYPQTVPLVHPAKSDLDLFHVAYPLIGRESGINDVQYALVISYNMNIMDDFLEQVSKDDNDYAYAFLTDSKGTIIYHENKNIIGTQKDAYIEENNLLNLDKDLDMFSWKLNIAVDQNALQERVNAIYGRGFVIYFLFMIVFIISLFLLMNRILKPTNSIGRAVKEAKDGNLHSRIKIEGKNEIWQLADEYNRMIGVLDQKNQEIKVHYRGKVESIERQHQAEREALESQINAHFICNTLGCISYEAIEAGNYQVTILIKKLSNILRYSFDQKSQEVMMRQEIAWIEQYLFLQKCRLEDVFDYEIDFPGQYGEWPCCKLMLQPFVENSILHGFEGMQKGGMIWIHGEQEEDRLKITIADNGCGMSPEIEKIIQEILQADTMLVHNEVGIGINNVVTRMRMYYGKDIQVKLKTGVGQGCKFTFYIPIPEHLKKEMSEENINESEKI